MTAVAYTMVGTNDLKRSLRFYDEIFELMGLEQCWRDERSASWGKKNDEAFPRFFTGYPFDGDAATVGNGTMTAFRCDRSMVDRLHSIALSRGGTSEGDPGFRPDYGAGFYAAYVRDPDGNKIAFVCYDAQAA